MTQDRKDSTAGRSRLVRVGVVGWAATLALAAACSPSDSDGGAGGSGDSGLSGTIDVLSIQDLTGAVGSVGIATQNGMKLAEKQINDSGMLGEAKLKIGYEDTETKGDQAVSLMSSAVSTDVTAIFGPVSSQEAVAVAPIGQSAKIPTIFTQAGSKGVVDAGDYVFRVTSPQDYYQPKMSRYLKAQGIKTVSFIYNSTVPTTKDLTEKTMPPLMQQQGIAIKGSYGFQLGTTDYAAYVSRVVGENPDAVGVEVTNPEVSPIISSLRNAGYEGLIFGGTSFGAASLAAAGPRAKGAVWATDFDPRNSFAPTAKFVADYKAEYNADPVNYAAEGFDAVYLLAYGLKNANSTDRTKLQAGMVQACKDGYDGALGPLKFEGNDLRQDGYLQTFDGTAVQSIQQA
jgi:branched-chain amino acid transport system substrate-binding protein